MQMQRAFSERRLHPSFQNIKPQIQQLTIKSKELYPLFSVHQLQMSRLSSLNGFQRLMHQISDFNQQIIQWRKDRHQITNLVLAYHLYENLFSRLKYISVFSNSEQQARESIAEALRWFSVEKPKKRNFVPNTKPELKSFQANREEELRLQDTLQNNTMKKQMQVYQAMARTAHSQFFPAKERLKDYRRKEYAPIVQKPMISLKEAQQTRTSFGKRYSAYRESMATRSTFKDTKESFRLSEKKDSTSGPQRQDDRLPQVEEIKEEDKERRAEQQEIIKQCIKPDNFEQDQQQQQGQALSEDEEAQQKQPAYKKFSKQPHVDAELIAQEKIKDAEQSTLRRIISHNQNKIQIKLEELDLRKNMLAWGKVKSAQKKQESRKIQRCIHGNKFKQVQHRIVNPQQQQTTFAKKVTQIDVAYRSKSSYPGSVSSVYQKLKVQSALKTYGRYIQHGNYQKVTIQQPEDEAQLAKYRGSSLTSHTDRIQKGQQFADLLNKNNSEVHNMMAQQDMITIKESLSLKHIPVSKGMIYRSTSIPEKVNYDNMDIFTGGKNLLSNPFFPKHLFETKKKKKKK